MYDRDALIAAVDLRALANELLDMHRGTTRSPVWPCPNHQHAQTGRTPPVSIFTSSRGEQRWRCHGCGAGGTAIDLVMACRGVGVRDAMDHLARRVGIVEPPKPWRPPRHRVAPAPSGRPPGCRDQAGMDLYVDDCAAALLGDAGQPIRDWLIDTRGLPGELLAVNRVGADLGPRHQQRPDGIPRASGVVLPAVVDGHAIYAQIRVTHPHANRPRYLNPTAAFAANPRIAQFQPT